MLSKPIETDPRLADLLKRAAAHKMTPAEIREQRVSFVYGQMNNAMTKDEVRGHMAEFYGWDKPNALAEG